MIQGRRDFELSQAQIDKLLEAMKPVPYMIFSGREPSSRQENANAAWAALGIEMNFDSTSVRRSGLGDRFFSAIYTGDTR